MCPLYRKATTNFGEILHLDNQKKLHPIMQQTHPTMQEAA